MPGDSDPSMKSNPNTASDKLAAHDNAAAGAPARSAGTVRGVPPELAAALMTGLAVVIVIAGFALWRRSKANDLQHDPSRPHSEAADIGTTAILDAEADLEDVVELSQATWDQQLAAVLSGRSESIWVTRALTDQDMAPIARASALTELKIDGGHITDAGLALIAKNPSITHLRLRHSPVSDAMIGAVAKMPSLRILNLPQSSLTAAGIDALQAAPRLRSLRLASSQLRTPEAAAAAAKSIARLSQLRSVHLIDVPIGDAGLMHLASMQSLASLYLDAPAVSDAAWEAFFAARPNIHVHINQVHHDLDPHEHAHP